MNEIATSGVPFRDQIPKLDREAIEQLEKRGAKVVIRWTSEGWRYEITRPVKTK